jgi:hypothetical protein
MTVVERYSRINREKKPPFDEERRLNNSNTNLEFVTSIIPDQAVKALTP